MEAQLPLVSLAFLSDTLLVGAGFDCVPLLLARGGGGGGWALKGEMVGEAAGGQAQGARKQSAVRSPLGLFPQRQTITPKTS